MDSNKPKSKTPVLTDNFIEQLRSLSKGVGQSMAKDVIGGIPETAYDQFARRQRSGTLRPNEDLTLSQSREQNPSQQRLQQEVARVRQEERAVFKQKEQQAQLEVKAIQQELAKLVAVTKDLVDKIEIAAKVEPVNPGVYHLNFFEKLRQAIIIFRKRVEESADWLALFNQRSKRKGHYWNQFKKSGTKFLLSQERYMSTQAG